MSSSFYSGSGLTSTEQDSIESAIAAAQTAQSGAETAKTASETAKTGAETAETNAETAQAAAEAAKVSAEAARDTANSSSSSASTSAATATTQAQAAAASASSASASATTSTTQAATATTQAQSASASASSASTSAATATTQANNSSTSAAAALASKNAAAASESQVSTDASTATTQAGNSATSATASSNSAAAALVSQNAAAASASSASTDAATATTKAGESSTSAAAALASQNASASSASAASTSATSAASSLSSFQNQYLGASSSAPTQDPDGSALDLGDLYFDTTANVMKVYSASGWTNASSSVNGTSERQTYTATANQTTFSVTYDAGFVDVWLNGAKLLAGTDFTATSGTNIVLASGAAAGDIVDIIAFGTFVFTSNDHYTKSASDTRYVQVAGDTMTGNLTVNGNLNVAGTTTTIDSANAQTVDLGDNDKIRLGDSDDLQIYHDGNSKIVDVGGGKLELQSDGTGVTIQKGATEYMAKFDTDGAVELYHDNSKKLETTATGVTISGNIANSSGDFTLDVAGDLVVNADGGNFVFQDDSINVGELANSSSDFVVASLTQDKDIIFKGNDGGSTITALTLDMSASGAATFNAGATFGGNVGINDTSPTEGKLVVRGDANTNALMVGGNSTTGQSYGTLITAGTNSSDAAFRVYDQTGSNPYVFVRGDGNVMIGTTTEGSSEADDLTLSGSGHIGMTIRSTDSASSRIYFSDATSGTGEYAGYMLYDHPANSLIFGTNSTERMRIEGSAGHVYIGHTSGLNFGTGTTAGITFDPNGGLVASRSGDSSLYLQRSSSNGNIASFYRDTTFVGSISVTSSATAFNTSSDYRLKENVVELTSATNRLKQLKPKRFNFIADADTTVDGFLAHEAQTVVPEAITGTKDEVDDDNNPVMQGIDQSKLVPLITAALQEAIAKIETLETRLTALEAN